MNRMPDVSKRNLRQQSSLLLLQLFDPLYFSAGGLYMALIVPGFDPYDIVF